MKKIILLLLLIAGASVSCRRSGGPQGDGAGLTVFRLNPGTIGLKQTKAVSVQEDALADVAVLQFDASGRFVKYIYKGGTVTDNELVLDLVSGAEQTVVFVANVADDAPFKGFGGTLGECRALTRSVADEAALTAGGRLPMYGEYRGTIDGGQTRAAVVMRRAAAKIELSYWVDIPDAADKQVSFTLRSIRLRNVPQVMSYADPAEIYPAVSAAFGDYPEVPVAVQPTPEAKGSQVWYVPENKRGTGTAELASQKTAAALSPGGEKATYVEMTGDYTQDGKTAEVVYRLYLGADPVKDYNVVRNTIYRIEAAIKGINLVDLRITPIHLVDVEEPGVDDEPAQDASFGVASPANCFMVVPGSSVTFDPRIQGNGGAGAQPIAPKSMGVLWQEGDGVNPLIRNVAFAPSQATVYVSSKIARGGNAVVAAYSGENCTGDILWSWHIWVTDYRPDGMKDYGLGENSYAAVDGGQVHTYGSEFMTAVKAVTPTRNRVIMDRNLGAAKAYYIPPQANDSEAPLAFGLAYQWGRKDPFPQWDGVSTTSPVPVPIYGTDGKVRLVENATDGFRKIPGPVTLNDVIKTPLTFYYSVADPSDWLTPQNNTLWGNGTGKSIYDPCPAGWRVAPNDIWQDFKDDVFPYYIQGDLREDGLETESAKTNGRLYRISVSGSGIGAWFPATGFYFGGNGNILQGELVDVGNKGAYWTSTASTYYVLYMWYDMNKIYLSGETYRSNSRPVRCIQE